MLNRFTSIVLAAHVVIACGMWYENAETLKRGSTDGD